MNASPERATLLALLGAALLFFGAFSPVFSVPIVGAQTFMQNGQAQGLIVIALAVVAAFFALTKRHRALWLPGLLALATIGYSYFSFRSELSGIGDDLPFRELREAALESVQLQWGWAVLLLGALLVCAAAFYGSANAEVQP
jgi:hypothetical protein